MRRAARVDDNQPEIVEALRAAGCFVQPLHMVGNGCPDLLVGHHLYGVVLIEVKDGSKPPSARCLTPAQEDWHKAWPAKVHIVNNIREALAVVGVVI